MKPDETPAPSEGEPTICPECYLKLPYCGCTTGAPPTESASIGSKSVVAGQSGEQISNDDSGLANPSKHQPNDSSGCAHAVTGEQPREYCGDSEHKPQGNGKQERDLPIVTLSTPSAGEVPTPRVVCLCGSSKHPEIHMRVMMEETLAGRIVIPMGLYGHADFPAGAKAATNDGDESTAVKQMLDTLHHRKIDVSDEVLVVRVAGYIGNSTRREVAYAESSGKLVRYYDVSESQLERDTIALQNQLQHWRSEGEVPTPLTKYEADRLDHWVNGKRMVYESTSSQLEEKLQSAISLSDFHLNSALKAVNERDEARQQLERETIALQERLAEEKTKGLAARDRACKAEQQLEDAKAAFGEHPDSDIDLAQRISELRDEARAPFHAGTKLMNERDEARRQLERSVPLNTYDDLLQKYKEQTEHLKKQLDAEHGREELRKERDAAIACAEKAEAFANRVERGESSFKAAMDEQLKRISQLPTGKTADESLADAVERCLNQLSTLRKAVEELDKAIADTFWTSDDGKTQRPSTPDDEDAAPEKLRIAWRNVRALNAEGGR